MFVSSHLIHLFLEPDVCWQPPFLGQYSDLVAITFRAYVNSCKIDQTLEILANE